MNRITSTFIGNLTKLTALFRSLGHRILKLHYTVYVFQLVGETQAIQNNSFNNKTTGFVFR